MSATEVVRARIDGETKAKASAALAAMGLSVSDAIRMVLHRIAEEKALPFEVRAPNAASRAAKEELEAGDSARFDTTEALFDDLGI